MTIRAKREHLQVQLLELEHLRDQTGDHPIMSVAVNERLAKIREELAALPVTVKEARTVLFFTGDPVHGSVGIDAGFVGKILAPFQNLVMTDFANRWHGVVGTRGRRAGEADARLLLTGLPRGSFGLELSRADNDELYEEDQLADSLVHVTRLLQAAGRSDDDFAAELEEAAPRIVTNLRDFLKVVADGHAGLRMESGSMRCEIDADAAGSAYERASSTSTHDELIVVNGVLKGILLDSWKFDFTSDADQHFGGKLGSDISEGDAVALNREFFNEACRATMTKTTVRFRNGNVRTSYVLEGLSAPGETQPA